MEARAKAARSRPNITPPPTIRKPLYRTLGLAPNQKVVNTAPNPPMPSNSPWPRAPTSRMSTANTGMSMM